MLKSISGSLTLKTEKFSSKITIPAKSPLDGQLRDLLFFIENSLKQHGDSEVIKQFTNKLLSDSEIAE